MPPDPVLVEVTRGPLVESRHRGAVAVADASGRVVGGLGEIDVPVYPRSAVKALQAIPVVESGAAARFGFTDEEVALACASHNGEARHVAAARSMLEKAGIDEGLLECGPQPPRLQADLAALERRGEAPGRIHNNCSGKHAGMLALAVHLGTDPQGYSARGHPVQQVVRKTMKDAAGVALREDNCGTDGCSVPTWAVPLSALAAAFARFATGTGMSAERSAACRRIRAAVATHPFMVAGSGRFCTKIMEVTGESVFVKTGAEGVFCAALPDRGLGVALKIEDGATRASETLMAALLLELAEPGAEAGVLLRTLARPVIRNWAGAEVGEIRVVAEMARHLRM